MKAGDVVKHRATGEIWTLACVEEGEAYPGGEPLLIVSVDRLELQRSSTIGEYLTMLRMWANDKHPDDIRHKICRKQLEQEIRTWS